MTVWEHESVRKDFVVMQAVIFPQINWLWLGCILMTLGSFLRTHAHPATQSVKPWLSRGAHWRRPSLAGIGPCLEAGRHDILQVVSRTEARHAPWVKPSAVLGPQHSRSPPAPWQMPKL